MSQFNVRKVAVLGAGVMGGNHARTLAALPGAKLHRIFDTEAARAECLAMKGAIADACAGN